MFIRIIKYINYDNNFILYDTIFDIYYDRSPKGSDQRKGEWRLVKEMKAV